VFKPFVVATGVALALSVASFSVVSAGAVAPKKDVAKPAQHQVTATAPAPRPAVFPTPRPQPTCGPPVDIVSKFMSVFDPLHACPV